MSEKQNGSLFAFLVYFCSTVYTDTNLYYYWPYGVSLSQV